MDWTTELGRRRFVVAAAAATSTALVGAAFPAFGQEKKTESRVGVEEVSAVEDLMREHGALNRIMLIFDEALRRIQAKQELDPALLREAATLVQDFIQGYHEKLEEDYVFPRLKRAQRLVQTVDTLLAQHQAGRRLIAIIVTNSTPARFGNAGNLAAVASAISQFNHMYRPHEAREDTLVFPEFKKIVTQVEYDNLGELFEEKEHQLFGRDGFEGVLGKIANIEMSIGTYDLARFTPPA